MDDQGDRRPMWNQHNAQQNQGPPAHPGQRPNSLPPNPQQPPLPNPQYAPHPGPPYPQQQQGPPGQWQALAPQNQPPPIPPIYQGGPARGYAPNQQHPPNQLHVQQLGQPPAPPQQHVLVAIPVDHFTPPDQLINMGMENLRRVVEGHRGGHEVPFEMQHMVNFVQNTEVAMQIRSQELNRLRVEQLRDIILQRMGDGAGMKLSECIQWILNAEFYVPPPEGPAEYLHSLGNELDCREYYRGQNGSKRIPLTDNRGMRRVPYTYNDLEREWVAELKQLMQSYNGGKKPRYLLDMLKEDCIAWIMHEEQQAFATLGVN